MKQPNATPLILALISLPVLAYYISVVSYTGMGLTFLFTMIMAYLANKDSNPS